MKKYCLLLSTVAVALCACTHLDGDTTPSGTVTEFTVTIPEFVDADATKTVLDDQGQFSWVVGDQLGFIPDQEDFGVDTKQLMFKIRSIGSKDNLAVYSSNGWGLYRGKKYYAYYPFNSSNSTTAARVNYTGQCQVANSSTAHLGAYDYLHADFAVPTEGNLNVVCRHISAIARFELVLPSGYEDYKIYRMKMKAGTSIFLNSGVYDPSKKYDYYGDYGEAVVFTSGLTEMSDVFEMTFGTGSGIQCNPSTRVLEVFAMMSPTQWMGQKIEVTLSVTTPDGLKEEELEGSFTPTRNQTPSARYRYASNVIPDGRIDLSANGTANCYVVNQAGKYRFNANVKGNGVSVNGASTSIASPAFVYLLWETDNTRTTHSRHYLVKNLEYKNGEIYFETDQEFVEGNAAIVLLSVNPELTSPYDYYVSNQNTLWQWHIWFVKNDDFGDDDYGGGKVFMDRNLGATSQSRTVDRTIGFLYQWGRPFPYFGSITYNTLPASPTSGNTNMSYVSLAMFQTDARTAGHSETETVPVTKDLIPIGTSSTIESALATPLQYNIGTSSCRHWNNNTNGVALWAPEKTMYDPCPPGYKVPDSFAGFALNANFDKYGAWVKNDAGNKQAFFWPLTGMMGLYSSTNKSKLLTNTGHDATYWTTAYQYPFVAGDTGTVGFGMNFNIGNTGVVNLSSASWAITGNPVRCQKIL